MTPSSQEQDPTALFSKLSIQARTHLLQLTIMSSPNCIMQPEVREKANDSP